MLPLRSSHYLKTDFANGWSGVGFILPLCGPSGIQECCVFLPPPCLPRCVPQAPMGQSLGLSHMRGSPPRAWLSQGLLFSPDPPFPHPPSSPSSLCAEWTSAERSSDHTTPLPEPSPPAVTLRSLQQGAGVTQQGKRVCQHWCWESQIRTCRTMLAAYLTPHPRRHSDSHWRSVGA